MAAISIFLYVFFFLSVRENSAICELVENLTRFMNPKQ